MPQVLAFLNPCLSTRNVGDHFIEDSVKRILDFDREHSIDLDTRKPPTPAEIARINACEAAVIVGTNLWYRDMHRRTCFAFTRQQLRQIRVPVIPLGIGTTRHLGEDNRFEPQTRQLIRQIHESCAIGGARDLRTLAALHEAGIRNVALTGCATLFRSLKPTWRLRRNKDTRQVVVTVRKGQRVNVCRLLAELRRCGLEPVIAAQQEGDMTFSHRRRGWFFRRETTLYEYDIRPYLQLVGESLGAIGWRLHGNMLHLSHGNPAVYFANCSRAASFCESFGLPYAYCEDHGVLPALEIDAMVARLFDDATFAAFPACYAEHYARMAAFLEANGLQHHLGPSDTLAHRPAA